MVIARQKETQVLRGIETKAPPCSDEMPCASSYTKQMEVGNASENLSFLGLCWPSRRWRRHPVSRVARSTSTERRRVGIYVRAYICMRVTMPAVSQ